VPEKIAYESLLKDWPEKPNIKSELTKLKKEIEDKTHENYISILCGNQYADIWQQIAFPNNKEIQAIKDQYYNQILEESNSEKMDKIMMDKIMNERSIAISEKLAELTRAEIALATDTTSQHQELNAGPTTSPRSPRLRGLSRSASVVSDMGSA
jgi:hypothetical protein